MNKAIIKVGIADMNIVKGQETIRTSGLGSCVGIVLYDEIIQIAGLAHIMLPKSSIGKVQNKAKFADTAISEMINRLQNEGARKSRLRAKIAGGAQMFKVSAKTELMRIGPRNIEAVKQELHSLNIPIVAQDIGGSSGRTIEFTPATKILHIRTVNLGTKKI
ncbi:chemotaxis protein CheD [Bacillus spongiae]|uniref:Chemoreceptor glutamine deamidase CheD n=1 Tax=Bacillus spongiae TaxID=2683610 RepID=A0ABU8HA83_9BACI